jgi:DNA modification methylase
MSADSGRLRFRQGNAAHLNFIGSGEADLVFACPPYYPDEFEAELRVPRRAQQHVEAVERVIVDFARTLQPAFREVARVLAPAGVVVLQTKDIRYSQWLVSLSCLHREMLEALGLRLVTRVWWQPLFDSRKHEPPRVGAALFRAREVEEFQVYTRPGHGRVLATDLPQPEVQASRSPLWRTAGAGPRPRHPHQSPSSVVRRLIGLYSAPGDLVVDPFAGSGTILEIALAEGRRAAGCDIDRERASAAERRLVAAAGAHA